MYGLSMIMNFNEYGQSPVTCPIFLWKRM